MSERDGDGSGEGERDHAQLIALFQEITGIEDEGKSLHILRTHNWDLEMSVQDALNEKDGLQTVFTHLPQTPPMAPPTAQPIQLGTQPLQGFRGMRHMPPHRGAVVRQTWWEWLVSLAFFPLRFVVSAASELLQFVVNLVFGFQPSPATNPRADVEQFVREFETDYGTTHPEFMTCSYSQALAKARQDLRFLLVYLHSSGHQDTPYFCRNVLANQEFVDFTSANMLVWGVGVNTEEGVRVSYILRENLYPFLALVVLKQSRMVVCERVEGMVEREDLVRTFERAVRDNEGELVVERHERAQREMNQVIREEQDRALQESMEADREKERRRKEEIRKAVEEMERQRDREEYERKRMEDFEAQKVIRAGRLPPEPGASDPDSLHVLLRMPSGERLERRFSNSDKLETLYDFAHTSKELPYRFILATNFPRQELKCTSDGGPLLRDLNLGKKCAIFVQDDTED